MSAQTDKERVIAGIVEHWRRYATPSALNELTALGYEAGYAAALERAAQLREVLVLAESHIAELVEAWQRGVFTEHDGQGGTRSNRNMDVHNKILRALKEKAAGTVS